MSRFCARIGWGLAALAATAGCDVDYVSTNRQLGFSDDVLRSDRVAGFASGDPVVEGSRACPRFEGWYFDAPSGARRFVGPVDGDPEDQWLRTCFADGVEGPATMTGECLVFDRPGAVRWNLAPVPCGALPPGAVTADDVSFTVLGVGEVRPVLDRWVERWALREAHPGPAAAFPAAWANEPAEPPLVAAGVGPTTPLRLVDGSGATVARSDGTFVGSDPAGVAPPEPDADAQRVWLDAGQMIDVWWEGSAGSTGTVTLEAASVDAPATLELAAVYLAAPTGFEAWTYPVVIVANVRTADGRLIHGAPVAWTVVEGDVAVTTEDALLSMDHGLVEGGCPDQPPEDASPTFHGATVRATLDDLTQEIEMSWTCGLAAPETPTADPPPRPDSGSPDATGGDTDGDDSPADDVDPLGCACRSANGDPPHPAWAWLVLIGWIAARGRRRRAR